MVAQDHMIALARVKCLVVKSFFLVTMVMTLGYPVWNWSDDVPVTAVLHPGIQAYLDIFDAGPLCRICGK
jgi:hypothetical protein